MGSFFETWSTFGSSGEHFGSILAPLWEALGIIFDTCLTSGGSWGGLEILSILGSSGEHFGSILVQMWEPFGICFKTFLEQLFRCNF